MPTFTATAPGKVILFGEHAVVYGRPALAVPVTQVQARATVQADIKAKPNTITIDAPDIGLHTTLNRLPPTHPIAIALQGVFNQLGVEFPPSFRLRITSTIPIAAGLGSGAAVSVAVIRVVSAFLGHSLSPQNVSNLVFTVEHRHHGTPSGIDNTVISFAYPVYFVKGQPIQTFEVQKPFIIVIGDTGVRSPTALTVAKVRRAWETNPEDYEKIFDAIGHICLTARQFIESGQPESLGELMDQNQSLLSRLHVSSNELEKLLFSARKAGALGAKLSGGGDGGSMIALVTPESANPVAEALHASGAVRTIITQIGSHPGADPLIHS